MFFLRVVDERSSETEGRIERFARIARASRISNSLRDDRASSRRHRVRSQVRARDRTRSTRACRWIRYVSIGIVDRVIIASFARAKRRRRRSTTRWRIRVEGAWQRPDPTRTGRRFDRLSRSSRVPRVVSIGEGSRSGKGVGSTRDPRKRHDVGGRLIWDFVRGIRGGDATRSRGGGTRPVTDGDVCVCVRA